VYDPVHLESFVAVAEAASFTQAAGRLGIGQSTVSQRIRRLEDAVGRQLLARDTRTVRLTDAGEAMLGFARTILAAHDAAEAYFTGVAMAGRLRFGAADDLALTHLPGILRDFRQVHPRISLELTVGQSSMLMRRLHQGQLDLVFVKQDPGEVEGLLVRRDRMAWVAHRGFELPEGGVVPLIVYPSPSLSRERSIAALDADGRPWRIACTVREVNAALAALRAGLGIGVFPRSLIPADLAEVPVTHGLPELGEVDFDLVEGPRAPSDLAAALSRAILHRQ